MFQRNERKALWKKARKGDPSARARLTAAIAPAIADGATMEDIEEYWTLPNFVLKKVEKSENAMRYATFLSAKDEGLNADDAAARVRKIFPMYGDPTNESVTIGDNRPLPPELRGRIDRYRRLFSGGPKGELIWQSGGSRPRVTAAEAVDRSLDLEIVQAATQSVPGLHVAVVALSATYGADDDRAWRRRARNSADTQRAMRQASVFDTYIRKRFRFETKFG